MKHDRVSDSNYSQVGPAEQWFESTPSDHYGRVAQLVEQECEKRVMLCDADSNPYSRGLENPVSMVRIHPLPIGFVWEPY